MLPLINIVLLLMAFFLLLGTVAVPDPFPLDPATGNALPDADAAGPTLTVAADGRLGFDGAVFGVDELAAHLARMPAGTDTLWVKADRRAEAAQLVRALGAAQAQGFRRVELLLAQDGAERP